MLALTLRNLVLMFALLGASAVAGCAPELESEPFEGSGASVGEAVYRLLCRRVAGAELPTDVRGLESEALCLEGAPPDEHTPPRLAAMWKHHASIVSALDAALGEPAQDELRGFLGALLPLYDAPAEWLPQGTRELAGFLRQVRTDEHALRALERLSSRGGYRPLAFALGVPQTLMRYPELDHVLKELLVAVETDHELSAAFDRLLEAIGMELAAYRGRARKESETTLDVVRAWLLAEGSEAHDPAPLYLALRDVRGVAVPTQEAARMLGMLDADHDGLLDVDARGALVARTGSLASPFPTAAHDGPLRDAFGRALAKPGVLSYRYRDLSRTVLSPLAAELGHWLEPRDDGPAIARDLLHGLPVLLGTTHQAQASFGKATLRYLAHDASDARMLDLVDAVSVLAGRPETVDMLALLDALMREHEPEVARLVQGFLDAKDLANAVSGPELNHPTNLFDDLLWILEQFARRSKVEGETQLEGVLRAITNPIGKHAGDILASMMRFTDSFDVDPADINQPPSGEYATEVKRDAPDRAGNRSVFSRISYMIDELSGRRVCNRELSLSTLAGLPKPPIMELKIGECELFDIDDAARAFGQAAGGVFHIELKSQALQLLLELMPGTTADTLLEKLTGIDGLTTHPTPEALVRMLFGGNELLNAVIDPLVVKHAPAGIDPRNPPAEYRVDQVYAGTAYAFEVELAFADGETSTFYSSTFPLVQSLNAHDYEDGVDDPAAFERKTYIFGDLVSLLSRYWPSLEAGRGTDPNGPFYSEPTNAVSYEGLMADMFGDGELVPNRYIGAEAIARHRTNLGIMRKLHEFARVLDSIELDDGRDGIDVLSAFAELALNPHKLCARPDDELGRVGADGLGACHADPGHALRYRRTGEDFLRWEKGEAYDGHDGVPKRFVSPLQLALRALDDIDRAFAASADPSQLTRFRRARSMLADALLGGGPQGFANPRARAIVLSLLDFVQERLDAHANDRAAFARGLTPRLGDFLSSPVIAATLELMRVLERHPERAKALYDLLAALLRPDAELAVQRSTLLAVADTLAVLRDEEDLESLLHAFAEALVPGAKQSLATGVRDDRRSLTRAWLDLFAEMSRRDAQDTLPKLLAQLATPSPHHEAGKVTPLESLLDAIVSVNRAQPGAEGPLSRDDLTAVLSQVEDFMLDERRGLERIYRIIQARELE